MSENTPFLDRGVMERIENRVVDILSELEDRLVTQMINSRGLAYGDIELPRPEALLKFVDDEARGVNAWLAQNKPEEWANRQKEFVQNAEGEGIV